MARPPAGAVGAVLRSPFQTRPGPLLRACVRGPARCPPSGRPPPNRWPFDVRSVSTPWLFRGSSDRHRGAETLAGERRKWRRRTALPGRGRWAGRSYLGVTAAGGGTRRIDGTGPGCGGDRSRPDHPARPARPPRPARRPARPDLPDLPDLPGADPTTPSIFPGFGANLEWRGAPTREPGARPVDPVDAIVGPRNAPNGVDGVDDVGTHGAASVLVDGAGLLVAVAAAAAAAQTWHLHGVGTTAWSLFSQSMERLVLCLPVLIIVLASTRRPAGSRLRITFAPASA